MAETESGNLEYISEVFIGLSAERKDYLLETARSLLNVQDEKIPANSKIISQNEREENLETMPAYAGEKIKDS